MKRPFHPFLPFPTALALSKTRVIRCNTSMIPSHEPTEIVDEPCQETEKISGSCRVVSETHRSEHRNLTNDEGLFTTDNTSHALTVSERYR